MTAFAPGSLFAFLTHLPDPRSPHGRRFSLISLLASACAAVLCGRTSYAAIAQWTRNQPAPLLHALGFFRKPPTDGAFRYLFSLLDLSAFETALAAWVAHLLPIAPEQLRPRLWTASPCGVATTNSAAPSTCCPCSTDPPAVSSSKVPSRLRPTNIRPPSTCCAA